MISTMAVSTMQEPGDIIKDKSEIMIRVIQKSTPNLVTALSECILRVANHCLAEELITEDRYESMLEHYTNDATKARHLLQAVKSAIKNNNDCFDIFLDKVLKNTLPYRVADKLLTEMKEQYTESVHKQCCQVNKILDVLKRKCSVIKEPEMIRFSGRLATRTFLRIDKAFQVAIHAGQVENVEFAAGIMTSINSDFQAIGLLYRASCRALIAGRIKDALKDCDRAIEVAKPTECQNGVLLTLRALRMKTSMLRTVGEHQKALDCISVAHDYFSNAAPSYDTAALLYEEIRLNMSIVDDNVTFSDVKVDYDRAIKHVDNSGECDFSQLFIFRNAQAEVLLQSRMIRDGKLAPAPPETDLLTAEGILNTVPISKLPEEAYVYRGWHYLTRSDLYMWRKEYVEAMKWAEESQQQFTRGGITYVKDPQKRLELLAKLPGLSQD